jgi:quercetin dioxygenase-like cupin family protein
MAGLEVKNFESPDETRPFEGKGKADVLQIGGQTVGRAVFEPGWRWSENVKPIAGTESCQVSHLGYVISGRMRVFMDDGAEGEVGPGDVMAIPPGHDAEVVGDEPCVSRLRRVRRLREAVMLAPSRTARQWQVGCF